MSRLRNPYVLTGFVIIASIAYLLVIGREPICKCGYVLLWYPETFTSENSQHLTDWYTPSHLIHGFLFFGALWFFRGRLSLGWRLLVATIVECAWEILENSDTVIERYREVTISLDYYGDSVINSAADIIAMVLGFWLSARLPVWTSVLIVIGFELLTMWVIRDGLALNIIMLIYPLDVIRDWQAAG